MTHAGKKGKYVELVSKELNHLAAILHVYAREILLIIFIVKSLQKEQNTSNLLL